MSEWEFEFETEQGAFRGKLNDDGTRVTLETFDSASGVTVRQELNRSQLAMLLSFCQQMGGVLT